MKYTALIVVFALVLVSLVASYAQDEGYAPHPAYQRVPIPLPMRGLNTSLTGDIPADQASYLHSFIVGNNELSWPDCYRTPYGYSNDLNSGRVNFLSGFRPGGGGLGLIFQSSGWLYIIDVEDDSITTADRITDTTYNTSTVSGTLDSFFVDADGDVVWKSLFGDGSDLVINIDSSGTYVPYNVDFIRDDGRVYLESALRHAPSTADYFFTGDIGDIVFGATFVDSFWILSERGKWVYGNQLTNLAYDSSYFKYTTDDLDPMWEGEHDGEVMLRYDTLFAMGGESFDRAIGLFQSVNHLYAFIDEPTISDDSSVIGADQTYHMMYPVQTVQEYGSQGNMIRTYAAFITPNTDSTVELSLHELHPDHSTYVTRDVDSIVPCDAYIITASNDTAQCVRIVSDSLFLGGHGMEAKKMLSGDWFIVPGDTVIDTGRVWRYCVAGGWVNSDTTAIYANECWVTSTVTDTQVTFYRRTRRGTMAGGYRCGQFWRNRLCSVHDTTRSQIDFSVAYYPESTSTYFVQINPDDGEDILWMREMYGNLIIGKQSSIWKLNGIPGLDNFASLELAWSGASFVVDRSIVNYNNLLFGLARDGFYVYDFNSMVRISDDINAFVTDTMDWEYIDRSAAAFFDDHYWISFPRASSGTHMNGSVLMYNPRAQAWTTSSTKFTSVFVNHSNIASDSDQVYFGSSERPDSIGISIYGRGTSSEFARWETGWLNFGSPFVEKVINRIFVVYDGQHSVASPFYVFLYHDNSSTYIEGRSFGTESVGTRKTAKFQFNGDQTRGYEHKFRFVAATSATFHSIGQVWVEYYEESVDY